MACQPAGGLFHFIKLQNRSITQKDPFYFWSNLFKFNKWTVSVRACMHAGGQASVSWFSQKRWAHLLHWGKLPFTRTIPNLYKTVNIIPNEGSTRTRLQHNNRHLTSYVAEAHCPEVSLFLGEFIQKCRSSWCSSQLRLSNCSDLGSMKTMSLCNDHPSLFDAPRDQ